MNAFALLGLSPSPVVAEREITDAFQRLAAVTHPDASTGDSTRFEELNMAWHTLREPSGCLRHFLEQMRPDALPLARQVPGAIAARFPEIADLCQQARALAEKRASTRSPLLSALMEPERLGLLRELDAAMTQIAKLRTEALEGLTTTTPAELLAAALASLVFLERWDAQLREAKLALA